MSTNTRDTENCTGIPVLDRKGSDYAYLGRDAEGEHHHHHHDKRENQILVTTTGYEEHVPDGDVRYHYRVPGDVVRVVDLDDHPDRDVDDWIDYVADERGWAERPSSTAAALARAFYQTDVDDILRGDGR